MPSEIDTILYDEMILKPVSTPPQSSYVSAVILIAFTASNTILMIKNPRGWDFPGGHVELGESPEAALHREAFEEAYVSIKNAELFLSATGLHTTGTYAGKQMLFYLADIQDTLPFLGGHETTGRKLVTTTEFVALYGGGKPRLAAEVLRRAKVNHSSNQP